MTGRWETSCWLAALLCSAFAIRRLAAPDPDGARTSGGASGVAQVPAPMRDDSLETLEETVTQGNLFRLARRPASAAFAPRDGRTASPMYVPPPVAPPKAALILKAIIGGPPWQGVIEGFPGREGSTMVRAGDKIDRYTVRSITRDSLVIQAPDTTYRLTMKSQWQ